MAESPAPFTPSAAAKILEATLHHDGWEMPDGEILTDAEMVRRAEKERALDAQRCGGST